MKNQLRLLATVLLAGVGSATEVDAACWGGHHHGAEVVQHPHLLTPGHPGKEGESKGTGEEINSLCGRRDCRWRHHIINVLRTCCFKQSRGR